MKKNELQKKKNVRFSQGQKKQMKYLRTNMIKVFIQMPNKIIKVFKYLSKKISTELNAY